MGSIVTDEFGQSFQIRPEDSLSLRDKECLFANVNTVASIAEFISSSLGPTGMDKILIDQDDNITVTNDGATILKGMDLTSNPISQLIMQLSQSQDEEVGDGTTSIVVLASSILQQAKRMIQKGMHPTKIAEGFSRALALASSHLRSIGEPIADLRSYMIKAAKTSLSSKIVSAGNFSNFAELCVDAVLATADLERRDLDMELINIQERKGGNLFDTALVKGIVLNKEFSHQQMRKNMQNAKIALLSCPFEPPKLKTKNSLLVSTAEDYKELEKYEQNKFKEMIDRVKQVRADVVMCQWGFDDEANSLLVKNDLPAVRWVGGHELGMLAAHISGSIIARFEDLTEADLGTGNVREETLGTDSEKIVVVENVEQKKSVTILVRGSTKFVIEEAKRSIQDAICTVRNLLVWSDIVFGGGSAEISASIHLSKEARDCSAETEEAIRGFARALLEIPLTLASNSGFEPLSYIEGLREAQLSTGDHTLGVDCLETGERSMRKAEVFEPLNSKIRQFQMATELVCMILKIHDVILIK